MTDAPAPAPAPPTVAALYVAPGGCYYGLPDVEPWGLPERDIDREGK